MDNSTFTVAKKVNDLIREYVSIEDELFKPSLRKVLPIPGIFRPVEYSVHQERLEEMLLELESAKKDIRSLKPDSDSTEGEFLITLRAYINAFKVALSELFRICGRLQSKREREGYSREEYKKDAIELRKMEMEYFEIGKKLNTLFSELTEKGSTSKKTEV